MKNKPPLSSGLSNLGKTPSSQQSTKFQTFKSQIFSSGIMTEQDKENATALAMPSAPSQMTQAATAIKHLQSQRNLLSHKKLAQVVTEQQEAASSSLSKPQ